MSKNGKKWWFLKKYQDVFTKLVESLAPAQTLIDVSGKTKRETINKFDICVEQNDKIMNLSNVK